MTELIDLTADFDLFDLAAAVVIRRRGQADVHVTRALTSPVKRSEPEPAGGQVTEADQVFTFPSRGLSASFALGDKIVDHAAVEWSIIGMDYSDNLGLWRCTTRNMAVAYGLDNQVDVLLANYSKSAGGEAIADWIPVAQSVRARVQPMTQDRQVDDNADWANAEYRVILAEALTQFRGLADPVAADVRLVDRNGLTLRVVSYEAPERIDALPVAACVLVGDLEE